MINGNLVTQTDAKGQTITCSYDGLNRIISKTFSIGDPAVTYVYDLPGENRIGRLASAGRGGHVTSYGYDAMGRTARETRTVDGVDFATLFTYDLSGKPASVIYPDQSGTVTYEYHDGSGLIHEVREGLVTHAALSDYTPTGQIGHIAYANGVSTVYTYDSESRRLVGINTVSGGNTLQSFLYGYTEGGDIASVSRDGVVYSYTYDGLHRLIGESSINGSIAYTYNNIGNMTQKIMFGNTLDYSYNDVAHKHAVSGLVLNGGSPMPFTYDANGNLVTGPDLTDLQDIESRTIAWNAENMPVQIVHSQFGTGNFEYDGLGQRSKKVIAGGSVTRYIGQYYEKVDSAGTRYVFAGNVRIARVTGAQTYYYHQDHLGSSTVMTDSNGVAQEQTAYLPYGSMRTHTGPDISNYKFTGQELDPETGLYFFNARYYDSAIGRFISADPMVADFTNPQSLNRYTYCLNNPLIYIDPSGYWTQEGEVLAISGYFAELGYIPDLSGINYTDQGWGELMFNFELQIQSIYSKLFDRGTIRDQGINFVVGSGSSAVFGLGYEGSGGIFFNPGRGDSKPNFGLFGSNGPGFGLNMSTDFFFGFVLGDINEPTVNFNLVPSYITITVILDLQTGQFTGGTIGFGPSLIPIGASGSIINSLGTIDIQNITNLFIMLFNYSK